MSPNAYALRWPTHLWSLVDPGLATHLLGLSAARLTPPHVALGPLLESLVVSEITRQSAWSEIEPNAVALPRSKRAEVDLVLEHPDGRIVGIEVKAGSTVGPGDFNGLAFLRQRLGPKFHGGFVLYTGTDALPFGPQMSALPVSARAPTRGGRGDDRTRTGE